MIHNVYSKINEHQRHAVDRAIQAAIDSLRSDNIAPCMADGAERVVESMAVWVSTAKRVRNNTAQECL